MSDDSVIKAYQRSANQELTLSLLQSVGTTIWTNPVRNLTFYEDKTNYTRIDNTIYSVNQSLTANIDSVPFYSWTYGNRSLTDDPVNYTIINNIIMDWFDTYLGVKMTVSG
jgi:hypothetical protein